MIKYLLPYETKHHNMTERCIRFHVDDTKFEKWGFLVGRNFYNYKRFWYIVYNYQELNLTFPSKKQAMEYLDAKLIEDGYYLIPEDKVEKFEKVLMVLK